MDLTIREDQQTPRKNPLTAVISKLSDLVPYNGGFRSSRQDRETVIANELELICFSDENLDTSLSKRSEAPADTARFNRATSELNKILAKKLEQYGEAHTETAKTLLVLARLHYHRENRASLYGTFKTDACVSKGHEYMDRFIAVVRSGKLGKDFFTLSEEPSETEKLIGDAFARLSENMNDESVISLTTAIALSEKAAAQRLTSWRQGAQETREQASLLIEKVLSQPTLNSISESSGVESRIAEIKALNDLERLDDLITCLSRHTEHWIKVEEDAASPRPWQHKGDDEVNRMHSEYQETKRKELSITHILSSSIRSTLGERADTFRSELLALEMLCAIGEFCNQEAPTGYERLYEGIKNHGAPNEYERALGRHFERYTTNLAERSDDAVQKESLLLAAELLARFGYGEISSECMNRIEKLGHFYRNKSGFSVRFVYPKFGGGDPTAPLEFEPLVAAKLCFQKAQEIAQKLGNDFQRRMCRDEVSRMNHLLGNYDRALTAPQTEKVEKLI